MIEHSQTKACMCEGREMTRLQSKCDDISIAGKKLEGVNKAKEELKQEYDMTDGGVPHSLLGMQVERNR